MTQISEGDVVQVVGHRNAFGEDISGWREFPYKTGDCFIVGKVEDGGSYPCPIVFPEGIDDDFWREDDLTVVAKAPAKDAMRIRIAELRAAGFGLLEAKRVAQREMNLQAIDNAQTVEDLKVVLRQIVGAA